MRGLPPVTIRTAERRFRSGPNLLSDLKILAVDGLAPKWFSSSTTQDSMGIEWMTVIYQRLDPSAYCVRGSLLEQNIQYRMVLISNGLRSVLRDKMRAAMPAKCGAAQLVAGSWANGPKYPRP